jgi:hypothetical protein
VGKGGEERKEKEEEKEEEEEEGEKEVAAAALKPKSFKDQGGKGWCCAGWASLLWKSPPLPPSLPPALPQI